MRISEPNASAHQKPPSTKKSLKIQKTWQPSCGYQATSLYSWCNICPADHDGRIGGYGDLGGQ